MQRFLKNSAITINRELKSNNNIILEANDLLNKLLAENKDEPKEVKKHTNKKIYPAIALYKTLLKYTDKPKALKIVDEAITKEAIKKKKSMLVLFKIPGLYKLYPKMFKKVTNNTFNQKSGFRPEFVETTNRRCKFNMTKCLFKDILEKNDALELLKSFCHTDDICNEGLHKKLIWNRKKAMGFGDSYCDFDIFIKNK